MNKIISMNLPFNTGISLIIKRARKEYQVFGNMLKENLTGSRYCQWISGLFSKVFIHSNASKSQHHTHYNSNSNND